MLVLRQVGPARSASLYHDRHHGPDAIQYSASPTLGLMGAAQYRHHSIRVTG